MNQMDENEYIVGYSMQPFYAQRSNQAGVLFIHGFTGSPASVAPWARAVRDAGYTVSVIRLPGHGTKWQDMNRCTWKQWYRECERALVELSRNVEKVAVAGFSMGGALALALALRHPLKVSALLLLNPAVKDDRRILWLTAFTRFFIKTLPPSKSDINKPNPPIHGYAETPIPALHELRGLWKYVRRRMHKIHAPLLLLRSLQDHVVPDESSHFILTHVRSAVRRKVLLKNSYHVATHDYDAPIVESESISFLREVLPS